MCSTYITTDNSMLTLTKLRNNTYNLHLFGLKCILFSCTNECFDHENRFLKLIRNIFTLPRSEHSRHRPMFAPIQKLYTLFKHNVGKKFWFKMPS